MWILSDKRKTFLAKFTNEKLEFRDWTSEVTPIAEKEIKDVQKTEIK